MTHAGIALYALICFSGTHGETCRTLEHAAGETVAECTASAPKLLAEIAHAGEETHIWSAENIQATACGPAGRSRAQEPGDGDEPEE